MFFLDGLDGLKPCPESRNALSVPTCNDMLYYSYITHRYFLITALGANLQYVDYVLVEKLFSKNFQVSYPLKFLDVISKEDPVSEDAVSSAAQLTVALKYSVFPHNIFRGDCSTMPYTMHICHYSTTLLISARPRLKIHYSLEKSNWKTLLLCSYFSKEIWTLTHVTCKIFLRHVQYLVMKTKKWNGN